MADTGSGPACRSASCAALHPLRSAISSTSAAACAWTLRCLERLAADKQVYSNAQMPPKLIRKHCQISAEGEKLLESAMVKLGLSARAHDRGDLTTRLHANLAGRKLIIGVDRLDYSKGLVERFTAFERLLETFPDEHRGVPA